MSHVPIEAAKLHFDDAGDGALSQDAGLAQRRQKMPQCRANLVTAPLHRRRTAASGEVLVKESTGVVICEVAGGKPAPGHPSCEVRDAAQVYPLRPISVASGNETLAVGRHELGKVAIAQPSGRDGVDRSERVHEVS
jgi:hypothetical protein